MFNFGLLAYGIGFLASVILPYVQAYLDDNSIVFDWRYVISRLTGSIIPLLLALSSPETVELINQTLASYEGNLFLVYTFIFTSAYGSSQLGQLGRKVIKLAR